jgi:cytochrome c peroxidase
MKQLLFLMAVGLLVVGCGGSDGNKERAVTDETLNFESLSDDSKVFFGNLPTEAANESNALTAEKILLGQTLYYDKRLSKNGTQSCNTCHDLSSYGVDNQPTSMGDDGTSFGTRNSPTVLNAALHFKQFWDGRAEDVEEQAGMPILNPVEMAIPSEDFLVDRLKSIDGYGPLFAAAFPNEEEPLTYKNLTKAIGAFERKLITPSRFDQFQTGDNNALTIAEKKGFETFIAEGCTQCHMGNTFGGRLYQKVGLYGSYSEFKKPKVVDEGRFEVTGNENDKNLFKVPSLRNIEKTGPYFHDGQVVDLAEAIKIMGKLQLNKEFSNDKVKDLITFLKTLTGEVPEQYKQEPPMPI